MATFFPGLSVQSVHIEAARQGARDQLARVLRGQLLRLLQRRGVPSDRSEDLAQDLVLTVMDRLVDSPPENPEAYVAKCARHAAFSYHKRRGLRVEEEPGEALVDPTPLAEEWLLAAEKRGRVRAAMAGLSGVDRDLLEQVYFEEKSTEELCLQRGVGEGALYKRHERAKMRLRRACLAQSVSGA